MMITPMIPIPPLLFMTFSCLDDHCGDATLVAPSASEARGSAELVKPGRPT